MPADELAALAVDVFGADRVSVRPRWPRRSSEAIKLAEAGPDDALGGSGVLVAGSVVTAGEARALLRRRLTAPNRSRRPGARGAAAADPGARGDHDAVRAARDRAGRAAA